MPQCSPQLAGRQHGAQHKQQGTQQNARQQHFADNQVGDVDKGRTVTGEAHVGEGEEFAVHVDVDAVDNGQHTECAARQDHPEPPEPSGQHRRNTGEDQRPAGRKQPHKQIIVLVNDPQMLEEILEPIIQGQQRQKKEYQMEPVGGLGQGLSGQAQEQALFSFFRRIHRNRSFLRCFSLR